MLRILSQQWESNQDILLKMLQKAECLCTLFVTDIIKCLTRNQDKIEP